MIQDLENQHSYDEDAFDHEEKNHVMSKVATSNDGNYIYLGRRKYLKEDLLTAFGGTLNPGLAPPSVHKFANAAPLGLSAFALSTFVASMIDAGAMGVHNNSIIVGLALFYGGFIQFIAGMWEMAVENTFGALALSSYGGFWMAVGVVNIPWFNIEGSYDDPVEFRNAMGFFLLGWTILTVMLTLCTMKSTFAFFFLFILVTLRFTLLTLGKLANSSNCDVAAGVVGVITAIVAFYNAYAGVSTKENSYITVSAFQLPIFGDKY